MKAEPCTCPFTSSSKDLWCVAHAQDDRSTQNQNDPPTSTPNPHPELCGAPLTSDCLPRQLPNMHWWAIMPLTVGLDVSLEHPERTTTGWVSLPNAWTPVT